MLRYKVLVCVVPLIITGCAAQTRWTGAGEEAVHSSQKLSGIIMEVATFDLDHSEFYGVHSYFGEGIISVKGNGSASTRPYFAVLEVERVRGGSGEFGKAYQLVTVTNGIGRFTTLDGGKNISKPEYNFRLVGFVPFESVPGVAFRVASFSLQYKDRENDGFFSESFSGKGIIATNGAPPMADQPYIVLLFYNHKGKDRGSYQWLLVNQGVGEFTTYESNTDRNQALARPEYDFTVIGAIPLTTPVDTLEFSVPTFSLTKEDQTLLTPYWKGRGIIKSAGDPALSDKSYIVAMESIRNDGAVTELLVPVINGIGQFMTSTMTQDWAENVRPEYQFNITGFVPLVPNEVK